MRAFLLFTLEILDWGISFICFLGGVCYGNFTLFRVVNQSHAFLRLSSFERRQFSINSFSPFFHYINFKPGVVKAPNQDLRFLKTLKKYETVDKWISKAALSKFTQHLYYWSEEIAVLSLFDDEVDKQTKANIVPNLQRESL